MVTAEYLYIYATGEREDGIRFAVGSHVDGIPGVEGARALFAHAKDAHMFAYAYQDATGAMVHVLPSAEIPA